MPDSRSIRPATIADIPSVQALIPLAVRSLSQGFYTETQIQSALRHVFGADTQLIADGTYFVVESNGRLAGCGGWSRRDTLYGGDQMIPTPGRLLDPATEPARIRAFYVHADFARQGVGSSILRACVEAAGKAGFKSLELVATLPGEQLYRRFEFESVERLQVPLPDGVTIEFVRMRRAWIWRD